MQDTLPGLAPPGPAVLGNGDTAAEAGDETADDEVGGVGAAGGGAESGEADGYLDGVISVLFDMAFFHSRTSDVGKGSVG